MLTRTLYRWLATRRYFRGRDRLLSLLRLSLQPGWVRIDDSFEMYLDPSEWLQLELMINGCTEPLTKALFRQLLQAGNCVIDVGAHVGEFTLLSAALVQESGRVIAIEPQPENIEIIEKNLGRNGYSQVTAISAAAGRVETETLLPVQSGNDRSRLSLAAEGVNNQLETFATRIIRLDTYIESQPIDRVRLLKIDVEGYEPEVLAGCTDCLERIDNIVLEVLPETSRETRGAMVDLLRANGFQLLDILGNRFEAGHSLPENNLWATRLKNITPLAQDSFATISTRQHT